MERTVHRIIAASLGLIVAAPSARADALADHDNAPFSGLFGLPAATESGLLLPQGHRQWSLSLQTASHAVADVGGDEVFIADGETSRLALGFRQGLGRGWEIGVTVPYVTHQAGGLDSVIDDWHRVFGFPDGPRDDWPRDRLAYRYLQGSTFIVDTSRTSHGLGDLRVSAGLAVRDRGPHRIALRLGVKLPTGDADNLHGSGGTDVSVGLAGDAAGPGSQWSAFYRFHAVLPGDAHRLSVRQRDAVWLAAGGIGWQATNWLELVLQARLRSALFESDIEMLGEWAVGLTLGAHLDIAERWRLSLGVGEDVKVGSMPDVTFQLGLRYRP